MEPNTALAPEIIWFNPSEEYLEDPRKMLGLIHQSSARKGMLCSYYGVDLEDDETGVWVMGWQTLSHHQQFMADASYVDFIIPVMDSMVGTGEITQLLLQDDQELVKALKAPLTAFIYITLRPLHDRAYELEPLAYIDNPDILKPTLHWIAKAPGFIKQWTGLRVEDGKTVYHVIEWETYEHHKNLPSLPNFHELIDLSKPCFVGAPTIFHVPFDVSADDAFDAPITEFCFAKPKNAEQKSEVVDLLNSLTKGLDKCYGPTLGTTREDSNTISLVMGWDTVKAHVDAVAGHETVVKIAGLADLEVLHAPLKKHVTA
ncbi:hypothetical protein EST38_g1421 [Candolleomyces aberdarensis]|uniref:ABM domain-containing protein n=1 Tax=Candolleomyces aberdarensis TaxID=2316362 RepID=A0A4Q2DXG5_9AGAR|nr:hypothetical protein EST38_g1421 [Candolleomyces aberdarensis]